MIVLSKALQRIKPSATVGISQMARKMAGEGRDVIALSAGEPDFDTPDAIKEAGIRAIGGGRTKYTNVDGIVELKRAVAEKFRRDNDLDVQAEDCFVAAGGKQIIFNALLATLNPGDEVIVPTPYWVSYPDIVLLAGAKPVFADCDAKSGFKLTPEILAGSISKNTKWLIINSPSNPTGAAYSRDELKALGEVLLEYPWVHVLSDDIYEQLLYEGKEFFTIAQACPELAPRVLTMNGVSKSHAMTGWRIGYCVGPRPILAAMGKLQAQSTTNPSSISQWAALEALNGNNDFLAEWREVFLRRRNFVVRELNAIEGLDCLMPDGAFYVFPSCSDHFGKTSKGGRPIDNDEDFVMALLAENGVALVHGAAFGMGGHFRLSYAASDNDLKKALSRIREFCQGLR